jgi:hypothetical protein
LGKRGVTFVETLPRVNIDENITILDKDIDDALNQAEYAVTHAIANHGQERSDFANLSTVMIETRDFDLSEGIAEKALGREWMRRFLQLPNKQIFVADVKDGVVRRLEQFEVQKELGQ